MPATSRSRSAMLPRRPPRRPPRARCRPRPPCRPPPRARCGRAPSPRRAPSPAVCAARPGCPSAPPRPPTPPAPAAGGPPGAICCDRQLGQGVGRVAPGQAHLDRAEVLEVARHRGLRGLDALLGQQRHQLRLARDRLGLEQLGDAVLALVLGRAGPRSPSARSSRRPSTAQARTPRMAVRRWAAWRHTTDCGPSSTSSVISSPRCAGRQCSTTASGAARSTSASSMVKPAKAARRCRPLLLLAHARPHVGVERGRALGRLRPGRRSAAPCRPARPRRRRPAGRPARPPRSE